MSRKYTVKPGDTLQTIAAEECGSAKMAEQIARDNHLASPDAIYPGLVLVINCYDEDATEIAPMPPELRDDPPS